MLLHGYTPTDLLKSSIISIPKDVKVSLSNIDNYRGIALFNCICKLYDNITLFLHGNCFNTSDMQFSYKKGHYFKMDNGVKQGGVISCHLFNLYIEALLVQLSNSGYGCHIASVYAAAILHSWFQIWNK